MLQYHQKSEFKYIWDANFRFIGFSMHSMQIEEKNEPWFGGGNGVSGKWEGIGGGGIIWGIGIGIGELLWLFGALFDIFVHFVRRFVNQDYLGLNQV